jgi:Golgi apparatus protein 1
MSKECKDEVSRDMNRMGQDYRLNFRLNKACESDIGKLCGGLCSASQGSPCGGIVLQCLQVRRCAACPVCCKPVAGARGQPAW